MLKALFVFYLIFISWTFLYSQQMTEDVIYLKNGSIIRGKIKMNIADTIKIESCRNLLAYTLAEIQKIEFDIPLEASEQSEKNGNIPQSGFYSYSSIGLLTGKSEITSGSGFTFRSSMGFEFSSYLGLGIGAGIENFQYEMIPFFISVKTDFMKRENTPFIILHGGYSIPLDDEKEENYNTYNYKGGLNAGFDIGICSYRSLNKAITISVGYQYQHSAEKTTYPYWNGNATETNIYDFNKITIKIGFLFK